MCHREEMTYLFILMTVVIYILITNLNILLKRMCQISYNTRIVYRLHIHPYDPKDNNTKQYCVSLALRLPDASQGYLIDRLSPSIVAMIYALVVRFMLKDSVTAYSPIAKDIIIKSRRFIMSSILIYKYSLLTHNTIHPPFVFQVRERQREQRERITAILSGWRQTGLRLFLR